MPPDRLAWIERELEALACQGLLRTRRLRSGPQAAEMLIEGQPVVNFGSNDYLGLANDPRLIRAASRALEQGWGSGASPLVPGYSRWHEQLEGLGLCRQPGAYCRPGGPRRYRVHRSQEPRQPVGRLPAFAGRRAGLSP